MAKKINTTLLGAVVIGGIALLILCISIVSSGRLFSDVQRFVLFFDSSLKGLSIGSNVTFRGVPIGRVTEIELSSSLDSQGIRLPVFIELTQNASEEFLAQYDDADEEEYLKFLISDGFSGSLNVQSFLTGRLEIELDFNQHNITPSHNFGELYYAGVPIIPTIPSQFDTLTKKIFDLPVEKITSDVLVLIDNLNNFLSSEALNSLPENINATLNRANGAIDELKLAVESINKLSLNIDDKITSSEKNILKAVNNISELAKKYAAIADDLDKGIKAFTDFAKNANKTTKSVNELINPNSAYVLGINKAIDEMSRTAKSVRHLADVLERNPESIIFGKGNR